MSVMRYTFISSLLCSEETVILTMPEATEGETLPFAAAVLVTDPCREPDYYLRKEPLERVGGMQIATVSLSGKILLRPSEEYLRFLCNEFPDVLTQFPVEIRALYAAGQAVDILQGSENTLREIYPIVRWSGTAAELIETLKK